MDDSETNKEVILMKVKYQLLFLCPQKILF